MELSQETLKILYLLESNAAESFRAIADMADLEEHKVRRTFHRLVEMKVITGRAVFVDSMALGYDDYGLFFSLKSTNAKEQKALIRSLADCPLVRWLADVGGSFDYAVTFLSKSAREVRHVLDRISQKHQDAFVGKQLSLRTYMMRYPRRYLSPHTRGCDTYIMGKVDGASSIDELDRQILNVLSEGHFTPDNEIATKLGVSPSTIVRRVAALKEAGILLGDTYRVNAGVLGYSSYRVLITMKRLGADIRRRMIQFCDEELAIRIMVESLGSWDYELELEVLDNRDIKQLTGRLYEAFPQDIVSINVIPIFQHLKYSGFPVDE
jgi:DNA-binding Lrp family transcriptional regulator